MLSCRESTSKASSKKKVIAGLEDLEYEELDVEDDLPVVPKKTRATKVSERRLC